METSFDICNFVDNITFLHNPFENALIKKKSLSIIKAISETWEEELKKSQKNQHNSQQYSIQPKKSDFVTCESHISVSKINHNLSDNNAKDSINKFKPSDLRAWGLPKGIVDKYKSKGVNDMFPWQVECLSNPKILENYGNLVYSAPTSAGKTLVAEILAIKNVLERRKKVIIILPFVSVVREKMFYFQDLFSETGVRVEGFMGSHTPPGGFQSINIAICTIEKANSLINKLLEDGTISELGAVIVDELHLIGDAHRGYILELLLTKLKYVTKKYEDVQIQVIGMSATLPNLDFLSNWLDADLYKTDFRPIPLEEHCLVFDTIYNSKFENVRRMLQSEHLPTDKDFVTQLCLETIIQNNSVLIFCPTKNWCENLAKQIAASFQNLGYSNSEFGIHLRKQLNSESISEVLEQLKCSPVGLDSTLESTISFGVAFHHAGLTLDERDIIEGAFKKNAIRVLIATSTLSSGVNLPARRVIIRSPTFCGKPINIMTYKQMIGRAGRMGIDSAGESILISSSSDKKTASNLMNKSFDPITSCLEGEDKLMRAVSEAISSNIAMTKSDVELFIQCTLLMNNKCSKSKSDYGDSILKQLEEFELIRLLKNEESLRYVATPLGKACLSSSMSPSDGLTLFIELQKARESFVLETDLHMIYLVTPYSICSQWGDINWFHFLNLWENLSAAMKRVGKLIGIQESFIYKSIRSSGKNTSAISKKYQVYKRFYTALALQDLINETPLNVVAEKFNCSRGVLQSLQQSAATFAGMVTAFSQKLGWKSFEILVSQFQDRLHFGIQSELLDLMKLQSLNALRARAIFNMGIETISQLATADIFTIENALNSAIPFQSDKIREGEDVFEANRRNDLKRIWITGKDGVSAKEAAELLILEARTYLQNEIGISEVKWTSQPTQRHFQEKNVERHSISQIQEYNITSTVKINTTLNNTQDIMDMKNNESKIQSILSPKLGEPISPQHSTPISLKKVNSIHIELMDSKNKLSFLEESLFSISNPNNSGDCHKEKPILQLSERDSIIISNLSKSLSLFEDSLTIDTQLCDILDSKKINLKEQNLNNNIEPNIVQLTNAIKKDSFSIKEAFSMSFEINDSNSITEKKIVINSSSNYVVPDSQFNIESNSPNNKRNVFLSTNCKKRKLSFENSFFLDKSCFESADSVVNRTPFKHMKISDSFHKSISKQDEFDITSNESFIDVSSALTEKSKKSTLSLIKYLDCSNLCTFNKIRQHMLLASKFSIFVNFEEITVIDPERQIGYNIMNKGTYKQINKDKTKHGNCKYFTKGISIFIEEFGVIYINLQSNVVDKVYKDAVLATLRKMLIDKNKKVIIYDSKKTFSVLYECFDIKISCQWEDPLIADWLLDSECLLKPLLKMANVYCSYEIENLLNVYDSKNVFNNKISCIKAWASWCVMKSLKNIFIQQQKAMLKIFEKEMKALLVLATCEISGICVDKETASMIMNQIKLIQNGLEQNAFKITGRRFKFTSSTEVAKALRIYNGRKISTNKRILEKVENPLAQIIIYWRKLNTILTKNIYPLLSAISKSSSNRIYGSYCTHTSTGRMSMQEPNLQSIPRNFEVPLELLLKDNSGKNQFNIHDTYINCRDIFLNQSNKVFISADYCQLELRLLAHMCGDVTLLKIINSKVDIFTAIASSWKCIQQEQVDDELRQRTKQMCYGIIYGMGIKALAECLSVCESDAELFMKTFHSTYPGIKSFTNLTIESCKRLGYVETLSERRRYLSSINSSNYSEKSHAERQAVNTRIQGSAADILKSAMICINRKLTDSQINMSDVKLVLLLHDELMYEVPSHKIDEFGKILKDSMENAIKLKVPLPVKMKVGKSWGKMKERKS